MTMWLKLPGPGPAPDSDSGPGTGPATVTRADTLTESVVYGNTTVNGHGSSLSFQCNSLSHVTTPDSASSFRFPN
jgi:hypothetical protein